MLPVATEDENDAPVGRPVKLRKTQHVDSAARETEAWGTDTTSDSVAKENSVRIPPTEKAESAELRSCENCRRCKLKCSRSHPCSKCVSKGIQCVYEQPDKKRGPRPGYIEELYRRLDALEHVVLGQSLMLNAGSRPDSHVPASFQQAINAERKRLGVLGLAQDRIRRPDPDLQAQTQALVPDQSAQERSLEQAVSHVSSSHESLDGQRGVLSRSGASPLSPDMLQSIRNVFRHQIHPWLPVLHPTETNGITANSEVPHCFDPLWQALVAATSPFIASLAPDAERHLYDLEKMCTQRIFRSANLDLFRGALIFQFLLCGNGVITNFLGLVIYLAQLALRAGLHLEDHHLTREHREFRELMGFDDNDQSWTGKETVRRIFWGLFLQDHFSAVLSGMRPSFKVADIHRLLPCDGQRWLDEQPVHTHEFVPAAVAVQVHVATDTNIGGLAYTIGATEIHAIVTSFLSRARVSHAPVHDLQGCIQEFRNLDFILSNWKAKFPAQFQRASYNTNGYIDHNVTLAHLTHNTSSILLYQWPHVVYSLSGASIDMSPILLSQITTVKQAAKEISKICTRFLLHRHYLVSPQFSYCQFTAARALLAYAHWTMHPVDEDYDTLYSSLGESAKRWAGVCRAHDTSFDVTSLKNFSSMLHVRLAMDYRNPHLVDLATPVHHLLQEMNRGDSSVINVDSAYQGSSHRDGEPGDSVGDSVSSCQAASGTGADLAVVQTSGRAAAPGYIITQSLVGNVDDIDHAMSFLGSIQPEDLEARIFSWGDPPETNTPTDPETTHLAAPIL